MSPKLLNLIDAHFQRSNIFNHLPIFDTIHYLGHPEGKIQLYKASREGQECTLLVLTIIRKEEDVLWEAAEDLLERVDVASGSDDAVAESFFDSNLSMNVVFKAGQRCVRQRNTVGFDGVADLLRCG